MSVSYTHLDVYKRQALHVNGGGLIGQSEINKDVPLANVEAFFEAWNEENT